MTLKEKTAVITGSGRGPGRAAKFSPERIRIDCREPKSFSFGGGPLKTAQGLKSPKIISRYLEVKILVNSIPLRRHTQDDETEVARV